MHFRIDVLFNFLNSTIYEKQLQNLTYMILDYPKISNLKLLHVSEPLDCFLKMSSSEGVPIAMMEASSLGIPLLGRLVGGVPEIVFHVYNRYLLHSNPSLVEISLSIANVPVENKNNVSYRDASRKVWSENFDSNNNYRNFVALLLDSSQ